MLDNRIKPKIFVTFIERGFIFVQYSQKTPHSCVVFFIAVFRLNKPPQGPKALRGLQAIFLCILGWITPTRRRLFAAPR